MGFLRHYWRCFCRGFSTKPRISPESKKDALLDAVTRELIGHYPDGPDACEDCPKFVDRTYDGLAQVRSDPTFLFSDSLGSWVVWNLYGHAAESEEEGQLVRIVGGLLVHGFVKWWKQA